MAYEHENTAIEWYKFITEQRSTWHQLKIFRSKELRCSMIFGCKSSEKNDIVNFISNVVE